MVPYRQVMMETTFAIATGTAMDICMDRGGIAAHKMAIAKAMDICTAATAFGGRIARTVIAKATGTCTAITTAEALTVRGATTGNPVRSTPTTDVGTGHRVSTWVAMGVGLMVTAVL